MPDLKLRINECLTLSGNPDPGTLSNIRFQFTHDNPRYLKNQRLGFSNYSTPQVIKLFHENGRGVSFPRGLVKDLFQIIPDIHLEDHTVTRPVDLPGSEIRLRLHQARAVDAMLSKNQGILVMPPGAGKTVAGIDLILKRGQKTLVMVHTKDLLQQWRGRFQTFAGIESGVIDDSSFDIGPVTVGMVQSLNSKSLTDDFFQSFGCVILDECHHAPAFTFERLINRFPARFRYGLTALPERRDGLSFILHGVFGPVLYEVKKDDLFDSGQIIKPVIRAVETGFYMPICEDYRALIDGVTSDSNRNAMIIRHLSNEAAESRSCLVLSERISHVENLFMMFSTQYPEIRSEPLTSKVSKGQRKEILEQAAKGTVKVLFATKLADEGLDLPILDRLFLTCPVRSSNKVTQQTGRIMRPHPGKQDAVVYDFVDSLIDLAKSQWFTRKREAYRDFKIETVK